MRERLQKLATGSFPLIVFHLLFSFSLFLILSFFGLLKGFPTNEGLYQWDAGWYMKIVENGYSFNPDEPSSVNFFPLFPVFWRLTKFSPILISVFNLCLLFVGMTLLRKTYHFNNREFLLFLSVPSLFFCYVPYSESFFFISSSLLLFGFKKDFRLAMIGLFLMGLTRSVSVVMIPILFFVFLIQIRHKNNLKPALLKLGISIVVCSASLLCAQYYQYLESGIFFTLFTSQEAFDHLLRLPEFYLTTWDGSRLLWLDGLAFFTGISAAIFCLYLTINRVAKDSQRTSLPSLISYAYLGLTTLVALFYSTVDGAGGTSLMSLNRYIFCTPFFMVFLANIFRSVKLSNKTLLVFVALNILIWPLFNVHGFLYGLDQFALPFFKTKLYFELMMLYAFAFVLNSRRVFQQSLWSGLYVLSVLLQLFLYTQFLSGRWIG